MIFSNSRLSWTIITILYMLLIMTVSLTPVYKTKPIPKGRQIAHNAGHVPAYALLTYFFIQALSAYRVKKNALVSAFMFSLLYGGGMEFFQSLVPGRESSLLDVLLNGSGALMCIIWVRRKMAAPQDTCCKSQE